MRSVRSLRVLLALTVGLMAMSAGLAQTTETTTNNSALSEEPTVAPEAQEPVGEVLAATTDPIAAATSDTETPEAQEPVTGEVLAATTGAIAAATSDTETPVLDAAETAVDGVNGDKEDIIDIAKPAADLIPQDGTLTTQELPDIEDVKATEVTGTVAGTTGAVAGAAAETASSGSLGTGSVLNSVASTSGNSNLAAAAKLGNTVLGSSLVQNNPITQAAGGPNSDIATGFNALKNGAAIASGLSACAASVEGDEAEINSSLISLGTSMVNTDTITGAASMGESIIKGWALANGQQADPVYQLFRIYLDQQSNTGKALTTSQEKAYSQLTPECNGAFEEIVETYNDSKGTVSSLMAGGKKNVTCSNYKNEETLVDMTLCVWPSEVWTKDAGIMANVTATFTNYGVQLCDVSFYVINLKDALAQSPAWLPDANTAFPDGVPTGTEVVIEASVPWTNQIAQNAPIVDILKGWSACPNGKAKPEPVVTPTPKPTEESDVIGTASACFLTPKCQAAVAPYAEDACGAFSELLSSGCSTCEMPVLKSAQASCLQSCAATYCGVPGEAAKDVTSGAAAVSRAFALLATLAMGAAAVLAF